jgi:endonuclease/exonuclease/phosphatase family metal-dependent hydrolase
MAAMVILLLASQQAAAQATGTFVDRQLPTDLRVVSYNVSNDSVFPDANAVQAAKFFRVMTALDPDIVGLQEIYSHTPADVVSLMNDIIPLGPGATWHAHKAFDNVIVSRFPLSLQRTNTTPSSPRSLAIALVNLPDGEYETDFYFMTNHFKCCGNVGGPEDAERQLQADALVNWMRDARNPGGLVNVVPGTPMAVVGDLNMVASLQPLNTLITGNIVNEATYGADSPPDWDASSLADARPRHNATGTAEYTWRDDASTYDPGRLDFILYTDSVASVGTKFVLNTVTMSPAERAATGLRTYDVTLDNSGITYDHLPLVVDFRIPLQFLAGDYDSDRSVDSSDYDYWRNRFGLAHTAADGNRNGVVDAADYVVWRKPFAAAAGASVSITSAPEPASNLLCISLLGMLAVSQRIVRPCRTHHLRA